MRAFSLWGLSDGSEPEQWSAAERTESGPAVARLLATLAKSQVETAGVDPALATMDRAARWAADARDRDLDAFLHSQRGLILFRGGNFAAALDEFNLAAAEFNQSSVADRCRLLINRGALYVESGDLRSARSDLLRCIEIAQSAGLTVLQRIAVHNLGCLEYFAGDIPTALRRMEDGMALDQETQAGIALLDRARVLLAAGLSTEADETLARAAEQLGRERCWQDVGEVELTRAECALLANDVEASRRLAGRARDRFRRHGNDRWRRNAEMILLQADLASGRPGLRLAPPALRLAAEFTRAGFPVQARTARLIAAEAYLAAGRVELAEAAAPGSNEVRRGDPVAARLHSRYVRARLADAANDRPRAVRQIRAGLAELAAHQSQFGGIDLQTASGIHGQRLAVMDLQLATESGRAEAVLAAVERGRSQSTRLLPVRAPADDSAAQLLAELRQVSEELRGIETDPAALSHANSLRRRTREIQRALRELAWQFEGGGESVRPAAPSAIGDELARQSATLVSYFQMDDQIEAVVWGDRRGRLAALGAAHPVSEDIKRIRADLDVMANGLLSGAMLRAVSGSLTRSLERLDDALVRPLDLGDERLVLVPSGLLATVPWTLLPSLSGRPVVVAPSATAWLNASTAPPTHGGDVLAIAGPDLKRAADEVKAVGRRWRTARVVHGKKATRDELARGITSARIVHVAAHGEHQMDNPLFSSLRLADAPIYAWELDQHAEAAEHVILSACELGQATIRPGDEALGLTSVLLHLGTRSVISGVARVHDDVAAEVMARYHRDLAGGMDSAQALAEACAAEKDIPAPFVCFGSAWSAG